MLVSEMPCGHKPPEAPRHVYMGGNRFDVRFNKEHFDRVIAVRRFTCFGESFRVTPDETPSNSSMKGA